MPDGLRPYNDHLGVEPIGNMFKLSNGRHTMRCALATRPLGWELRLTVGDELMRSQVCKTRDQVFDVSEAWRGEAVGNGWA